MHRSFQLCVRTPYGTIDDFLADYACYWSGASIFLCCRDVCNIGERAFVEVLLANGAIIMSGEAEIIESYPADSGPDNHSGMRVRFDDFGAISDDALNMLCKLMLGGTSAPAHRPPSTAEHRRSHRDTLPIRGAAAEDLVDRPAYCRVSITRIGELPRQMSAG